MSIFPPYLGQGSRDTSRGPDYIPPSAPGRSSSAGPPPGPPRNDGTAVAHRDAQEGEADPDVDAREAGPALARFVVLEAERLHGDVPLVVVHRDDDVELAAARAGEHGVRGRGAGDVEPRRPRRRDRRRDRGLLLVAEEAVLAGGRGGARGPAAGARAGAGPRRAR